MIAWYNKNHDFSIKKGFTLVELIVVITILSILGTIGFISYQWFVWNSRNSVRLSDVKEISKGLETFRIKNGAYPPPSDSKDITFSWAKVWSQGIIGDSLFNILKTSNISDVLYDRKYTYSVTSKGNEYQIAGVYEWEQLSYTPLSSQAYASEDPTWKTFIEGNYNGIFVSYNDGTNIIYITTPSIILSDISTPELREIKTMSWYNLALSNTYSIPHSMSDVVNPNIDLSKKFYFKPFADIKTGANEHAVIWKRSTPPQNINDAQTLATNINTAYSGTTISEQNNNKIAEIISTDSSKQAVIVAQILNQTISWNIDIPKTPQATGLCIFGIWIFWTCSL